MATVNNTRVEVTSAKTLELRERPLPPVPPHGLIIKTKFAGICHSDLHVWEDAWLTGTGQHISTEVAIDNFRFPAVLGHEIAGEVYAVGSEDCEGAPVLAVGDAVVVFPWFAGCYPKCRACAAGHEMACYRKPQAGSFGLHLDGGFESYVVVERRSSVVPVPAGLSLDVACMAPCSGITALGAINNAMPVVHDSIRNKDSCSVLVCGVGGVGMWAVSLAKAVLPPQTKIYVVDVEAAKVQWAVEQGIAGGIHTVQGTSDEAAIAQIKEITGGGVDVALDFVGISSSSKRLSECLNKNGILVLVGMAGGNLNLSTLETVVRCITIKGSQAGDKRLVGEVLSLMAQNKVKPPQIYHCSLSVEDITAVFNKLIARQVDGRCVIKFT